MSPSGIRKLLMLQNECIFHKCEKKSQNVQSFGYFDSFSSVDVKIYDISIYQYLYNDNYGIFAKKSGKIWTFQAENSTVWKIIPAQSNLRCHLK